MVVACAPDDATPEVIAPTDATCLGNADPTALTSLFDLEPGGLLAADYQRAIDLPDGRRLWLFQDATVAIPQPPPPVTTTTTLPGTPPPPEPETERLLHNAGMLQTGTCFELLISGTSDDPGAWLFPTATQPFQHWFWPLDATIAADGLIYVFAAEMVELGALYLSATHPTATHFVALDATTLDVVGAGRPPDSTASLYGFSIAEDADWTYLYAQCHRQFGWDPIFFGSPAHDFSCSADVTVARVPRGRVLDVPQYWDGTTWQADPARAAPVMPTGWRKINPTQVVWTGSEFLAVTKEGDWFGNTIYLDRAPTATGPWTTYARVPAPLKCERTTCNNYFASWIPSNGVDGPLVVGLSHNRWDGQLSDINRPTFSYMPPPGAFPLAARCSMVQC